MFWLAALALYAGGRVLDIFWALWSRSWPLTLVFYLPFAIPLELAFYFHSRRFVRKRSEELHTTFVGEPDAAEALRCWAHILSDRPPAELGVCVRLCRRLRVGSGDEPRCLSLCLVRRSISQWHRRGQQRAVGPRAGGGAGGGAVRTPGDCASTCGGAGVGDGGGAGEAGAGVGVEGVSG